MSSKKNDDLNASSKQEASAGSSSKEASSSSAQARQDLAAKEGLDHPIKTDVDKQPCDSGTSSKDQQKKQQQKEQPKRSSLLEDHPNLQQYPFPPSPAAYGLPSYVPGQGLSSPGMPPGTFPRIGGNDLDPFADPHAGGMLFDPFQQRNPAINRPRFPNSAMAPPGARFDPTTPFDFPRGPRPPNPDHSKMPNPDWNDPFI